MTSPTHHDRVVRALRQGPMTFDQLAFVMPPMHHKPGARRRAVAQVVRLLMRERHAFAVVNGRLTQYHLRMASPSPAPS